MKKQITSQKLTATRAVFSVLFLLGIASFFFLNGKDGLSVTEEKDRNDITRTPLLFVGDIMFGRYVETLLKERGQEYLFGNIRSILQSHITIANLEGPIPEKHKQTPIQGFQFSFPSTSGTLLYDEGVQAVSLANNHSMDWGISGYTHTKKVLDESRVSHFGGYGSTEDDYFETKIGTTSVVVFGINMITDTWDREKALSVARKMRKEHPGSYVIAYMHWGEEYMHTQNERQRVLAHQLIDGGVDIIIGSHPHVVQGIETYKEGIIFYSLGNFIFDQYFSQETQEGYMLSIDQEGDKIHYKLMPIVSKRSRVEKADLEDTRKILEIISNNSSPSLRHQIKSTGSIVFDIPHRVSN